MIRISLFVTMLAVTLGACSPAFWVAPEDLAVTGCRNPEERRRLQAGDTYRDLAYAHADAVAGWRDCSSAAKAGRALLTGEALE